MIYGYIIGLRLNQSSVTRPLLCNDLWLRTEITEEEIPVIEDNTKIHFNNISVISWRSVLLEKETGGPGENHRSVASHWQTLSHNVVHLALRDSNTQHQWWYTLITGVVVNPNTIYIYNSNTVWFNFQTLAIYIYIYIYTITATKAPSTYFCS